MELCVNSVPHMLVILATQHEDEVFYFKIFKITKQTIRNHKMTLRKFKILFQTVTLFATVGLLSACGTPYRPAPFWGAGGYSSADINSNTVKVSFLTGSSADMRTISSYIMYRSAEITLERGYDGFRVLDASGFSSNIGGRFSSAADVKIFLMKLSAIDKARYQATQKTKHDLLKFGMIQKGEIYMAKDVKEILEPQIEHD